MQANANRPGRLLLVTIFALLIAAGPARAQWVQFSDQSASRIDAAPGDVVNDPEETEPAQVWSRLPMFLE